MTLDLLYGIGLIVVMGLMIWIARPAKGQDSVPWLRIYIVGQVYVMAALICGVTGVSLLIIHSPF